MNKCILPWTHIEIDTRGYFSLCCIANGKITTDNSYSDNPSELFHILTHSIEEVWNSDYMLDTRNNLLNDVKIQACNNCWKLEDSNIKSRRHLYNGLLEPNYKHFYKSNTPILPVTLDLKLGNMCNLSCRTCDSFASTGWIKERVYHKRNDSDVYSYENYNRSISNWTNDDKTWYELEKLLPNLIRINISGGEPMLIKKQFIFLEKAIEKGYAKNIEIQYNTNGTYIPKNAWAIWKHFKKIMLSFSLDGIGERLEYIRYPAKFSKIEENMKKARNYDNIDVDATYTWSNMNIFYVDEFINYCNINKIPYFLNSLFNPPYYSIQVLPLEVKKIITNKLSNYNMNSVLQYMNDKDDWNKYKELFITNLKLSDNYRNQKYEDIFPEFWNLLSNRISNN